MSLRERVVKDMPVQERSWSSLPDDLLERILSRLPLKGKLTCRCVCKAWNSLLSSDRLLTYSTNHMGDGKTFFLLSTKGPLACALDPCKNSWQKLHQPAVSPGASIVAAGGSLVCIGNQVSECRSLTVCNPVTKLEKELPHMPKVGLLHKVAMAVDACSNSYLIVVTGEDSSDYRGRRSYRLLTEVYDSVLRHWRRACDVLPDAKFGSDPGIWCNGLFYCITVVPYGLIAFLAAEGRWIDCKAKMPEAIASPSLVSCRGELMMVGIIAETEPPRKCCCQGIANGGAGQGSDTLRKPLSSDGKPHQSSSKYGAYGVITPSCDREIDITGLEPKPARDLQRASVLNHMEAPFGSHGVRHDIMASRSSIPSRTTSSSGLSGNVCVWSYCHTRQEWDLVDRMPEGLRAEFLSHLTQRTPLVCSGVGGLVCISSYLSPSPVVCDTKIRQWGWAAPDPLFPRCRDPHLMGFSFQPNPRCLP